MARKLDLSLIHDSSVESVGENSAVDMCRNFQDNDIDTIEQSPIKDTCNGHIENIEEATMLDEVAITGSPSSPFTAEGVKSSDDEMDREEDSKNYSPSQLEQRNANMIDRGKGVASEDLESSEGTVKQITSTVTKKLGHRDLREFAFKKKSERNQGPPSNSRSLSLPSSDVISRMSNRKIMSSEDFLCPLERKKHKPVAAERDLEVEESAGQVNSVQDIKLKTHDEPAIKNVSQSIKVICHVTLLMANDTKGKFV